MPAGSRMNPVSLPHRNKSIATCSNVWGDSSGTFLQRDEYPFTSTKEGSNN